MEAEERVGFVVSKIKPVAEVNFRSSVVDDDCLGAVVYHSCNHIVITRELVNILNNDELAAILAHEIAHLQSPNRKTVLILLGDYSFWALCFWLITGSRRAVLIKKFFHDQELYCDAEAVNICHKAGFNRIGMLSALEKIKAKRKRGILIKLSEMIEPFHPKIEKRIAVLLEIV